jgi:membrane protein
MADAPSPSRTTDSSSERRGRLSRPTLVYMAKRVLTEFTRDGGTDQAAKLTYFMVLSVAPTLLAVFSLATLLLSDLRDQIAGFLTDAITSALGSSEQGIADIVTDTVQSLLGSSTGGTIALIIGVLTALWSASAYIKAYSRVANQIYEVPEGRGILRMNAVMLGLTVVIILGILLIMVSLLLNQTLVDAVLGPLAGTFGLGGLLSFLTDSFLPIWAWLRWPVLLLIAFVLISVLYWGAPNVKKPFRLISPGGVVAILGIGLAAVAVVIYMSTVAGYSSYGAIGGVMAVLFALWIMNIVILIGAEVDAEYERAVELEAGEPAEESLVKPMRASDGAEKAEAKYQQLVDDGRDIRLRHLHRNAEAYIGESSRLTPTGGIPTVDPADADDPPAKDS